MTVTQRVVVVELTDDRMQAWIRLASPDDPQPLTSEAIVKSLEERNIVVNDAVLKRINDVITLNAEGKDRQERVLVAEGIPVVEGKNAELLWDESFKKCAQDWQGNAPVDYYRFNSIVTVEVDQPIGTLVPAVPGSNGADVFGKTITPKRCPKDVQLDSSVRMSDEDATTVLAGSAGKVVYEDGRLSISEVFKVAKDVSFETGNIDSSVHVDISGTVRDLFTVKSEKAVSVGGAVEAAEIDAQGDVLVRGGILQRGTGSVKAGGDIVARFCDGANLHAAGNIKIAGEIMNSRVHCDEKLLASRGAVIGGQFYAREGVEVATLGSDACVPTEIIAGIHPGVVREAERLREGLKEKSETAERIRQTVQPLMADLKRLSPAQRERATELLFTADALESEVAEVEVKRTEMLEAARAGGTPYVLVSKAVHSGVSVRIGRRHTVFTNDCQGPVKIEKRKIDKVTEFVAVNQLSGSITILPSEYIVEHVAAETQQPAEEGSATRQGSGG